MFTLCIEGILALLVLGHFVWLVLLALLAVGPAGLRDVHLRRHNKHFEQTNNYVQVFHLFKIANKRIDVTKPHK